LPNQASYRRLRSWRIFLFGSIWLTKKRLSAIVEIS